MKKLTSNNIYEYPLVFAWNRFSPHLSGNKDGLFLVLSTAALEQSAQHALAASAKKLGFGDTSGTFAVLQAEIHASNKTSSELHTLSEEELFDLIEGIDPSVLVSTDTSAAHMLSQAYRTDVSFLKAAHFFGRPFVAFRDFEAMLQNDQNKQHAWALLKTLKPTP